MRPTAIHIADQNGELRVAPEPKTGGFVTLRVSNDDEANMRAPLPKAAIDRYVV